MSRKKRTGGSVPKTIRNDLPPENDFYAASPSEQPLNEDRGHSSRQRIRKTSRHQADSGRKKDRFDPREQQALRGILQLVVIILVLIMALFGLYKGISLHEERIRMDKEATLGVEKMRAPAPDEAARIEFDSDNLVPLLQERSRAWERAGQSIRSVDALMKRDNRRIAIDRCLDVLKSNPYHQEALEHLSRIYEEEGLYEEAARACLQLLSIHPGDEAVQRQLIEILDEAEKMDAVVYLASWYTDHHAYNPEVQRYLANALALQEQYEAAAVAYERVLKDTPDDLTARRALVDLYIVLEQYEKALDYLKRLDDVDFREATHHRNLIICNAQLGNSQETVQSLGRAAHLFGQQAVLLWIQDPRLDPVRQDRTFQAFADRVGGEEFRKWLERVAEVVDEEERETMVPQLKVPTQEEQEQLLLKPRN